MLYLKFHQLHIISSAVPQKHRRDNVKCLIYNTTNRSTSGAYIIQTIVFCNSLLYFLNVSTLLSCYPCCLASAVWKRKRESKIWGYHLNPSQFYGNGTIYAARSLCLFIMQINRMNIGNRMGLFFSLSYSCAQWGYDWIWFTTPLQQFWWEHWWAYLIKFCVRREFPHFLLLRDTRCTPHFRGNWSMLCVWAVPQRLLSWSCCSRFPIKVTRHCSGNVFDLFHSNLSCLIFFHQ